MPNKIKAEPGTPLADDLKDMTLEGHQAGADVLSGVGRQDLMSDKRDPKQEPPRPTTNGLARPTPTSSLHSPRKSTSAPDSSAVSSDYEEVVGGDIMVKMEGKTPKLARSASRKIISRPPPLFSDLPDASAEACKTFVRIPNCTFANKYLGTTDHALDCDCVEEWDATTQKNNACDEDSDCINRATKMECVGDCNCGSNCQNQRFQRKQYANVTVIKTEKKGYGLRANTALHSNAFIFEYIGEVIGEAAFRRRLVSYDEEGVKHFYFMSLNKGEFIDATKNGNLGRFCNHSCNPNCYVDKWVVGDRLRMGIFAERKISAGEELTFNYNVDRYGADPQPCYCGEPNCTGFIGGKTQTERATKLSLATIEALGIEDAAEWDTATAKKGKKKKTGEDDEEYVDGMQPRSLDLDSVTKVMATLMQCKEKWIAVKLLGRIQACDEERVMNRVVRVHGYQILNAALTTFIDDTNLVLQILDVLNRLPRLTKNKIQDSKIEATVEKLVDNENDKVREEAASLLKIWSALEVAYRIPRMKRDPAADKAELDERRRFARDRSRSRSRSRARSRSRSPPMPKAPTGPKSNFPQRAYPARPLPPSFRRNPFPAPLPSGWFAAQSQGNTYYYSASGETTWVRPKVPASQPPPPPKEKTDEQKLQDIIDGITKPSSTPTVILRSGSTSTPSGERSNPKEQKQKEKWRSYSEEKQMKLYENALFPHIAHVMGKFKGKLSKDDLKRFGKEVAKKIVASDFKNRRVENPTHISDKQERVVRKYVKEYFDKAVGKKIEHDRRKEAQRNSKGDPAQKALANGGVPTPPTTDRSKTSDDNLEKLEDDDAMVFSENEIEDDDQEETPTQPGSVISPSTSDNLKRKRGLDADIMDSQAAANGEDADTPSKRFRDDEVGDLPTPPPPPPPPADDAPSMDGTPDIEGDST